MKKILIIEDEQAYIKLLLDKFVPFYQIITASNGKKGLELAIKEQPDLILLDIRLPVMDGLTMLQKLRQDQRGKKVKVILLTNFEVDRETIKKMVEYQPVYYFVKSDITMQDLAKTIKDTLAK